MRTGVHQAKDPGQALRRPPEKDRELFLRRSLESALPGRNKVEGLMDGRKLIQQLDHSVVVLERMKTHPWQPIFTRDQVLVKRLVLVPKDGDAQNGHFAE